MRACTLSFHCPSVLIPMFRHLFTQNEKNSGWSPVCYPGSGDFIPSLCTQHWVHRFCQKCQHVARQWPCDLHLQVHVATLSLDLRDFSSGASLQPFFGGGNGFLAFWMFFSSTNVHFEILCQGDLEIIQVRHTLRSLDLPMDQKPALVCIFCIMPYAASRSLLFTFKGRGTFAIAAVLDQLVSTGLTILVPQIDVSHLIATKRPQVFLKTLFGLTWDYFAEKFNVYFQPILDSWGLLLEDVWLLVPTMLLPPISWERRRDQHAGHGPLPSLHERRSWHCSHLFFGWAGLVLRAPDFPAVLRTMCRSCGCQQVCGKLPHFHGPHVAGGSLPECLVGERRSSIERVFQPHVPGYSKLGGLVSLLRIHCLQRGDCRSTASWAHGLPRFFGCLFVLQRAHVRRKLWLLFRRKHDFRLFSRLWGAPLDRADLELCPRKVCSCTRRFLCYGRSENRFPIEKSCWWKTWEWEVFVKPLEN